MVDIATERLLSLTQAANLLPPGRGGRPTHCATLVRWITYGVAGPDGGRVHLRAVKVGSRWLIPAAAFSEFAASLTPGTCRSGSASASAAGPAARQAAARLGKIGI